MPGPLKAQIVDGEPLAAVLRSGPLDVPTAVRIAIEIAEALDAAHADGMVHRDLNPENVVITPAGARLLDVQLPPRTVVAVGTRYQAPEQITGRPADPRSDIFSLGAVLYEMLTGRQPFGSPGETGATMATISAAPVAPSQVNPAVPPPLDAVVTRCLATAPADRWQTIRALLNALTVALHEPQAAHTFPRWAYAAAPVAAAAVMTVMLGGCPRLGATGTAPAARTGEAVAISPATADGRAPAAGRDAAIEVAVTERSVPPRVTDEPLARRSVAEAPE